MFATSVDGKSINDGTEPKRTHCKQDDVLKRNKSTRLSNSNEENQHTTRISTVFLYVKNVLRLKASAKDFDKNAFSLVSDYFEKNALNINLFFIDCFV